MRRLLRSLWRLAKAAAVVAAVVAGLVWVSKRRARQTPAIEPPVWPPLPLDESGLTVVAEVGGEPSSVEEAVAAVEGLDEVVEGADLDAVEDELVAEAAAQGIAEARGDADVTLAPDPVGAETAVMWVLPKDGECPDGYPVKAKVASRIYHLPGGTSYARTSPDRCYATPEDAEADGFRPAKR